MPKASKVSRHYHSMAAIRLYYGAPPASQLISDFLKSSWATPDDDRAREILLSMTVGQKDRERGYADLSDLAGKGSMLAAYVLAVRDYKDPRSAGYARAAQVLEELAERNFWPAMYQLVGSWTTKDLARTLEDSGQRIRILSSYARMGSIFSVILLGDAYLEGRYRASRDQLDTLMVQLLEGVRLRSWECLRILINIHTTALPDEISHDFLEPATEMLRLAALAGMTDAMSLLAKQYQTGRILPRNIDRSLFWYRKAWLGGNLDAGCTYARMLLDYAESDEEIDEARRILEYGCSQMHAASHVGLAEYFLKIVPDDKHHETFVHLIHTAARLGDPSLFARYLYENMRDGGGQEVAAAFNEPCMHAPEAAYMNVMATILAHARKKNFPSPTGATLRRLEALANEGYAPACDTLAEICHFGMYGYSRDDERASYWLALGMQYHSLRCWTLHTLNEIEHVMDSRTSGLVLDNLVSRLHTLGDYDDMLAQAAVTCQVAMLNSPDADKAYRKELKDKGHFVMETPAQILSEIIMKAGHMGDLAALAYLELQFREAYGCVVHKTLASLVAQNLGFDEWLTCRHMAQVCRTMQRTYIDPVALRRSVARGSDRKRTTGETETGARAREMGRPKKPGRPGR